MTKLIIKVKIERNQTKIYFNKKEFNSRFEAVKACISHLETVLEIALAKQAIKNSLNQVKEFENE